MRIAILAHAHPDWRPGGAEMASYALFQNLKSVPGLRPTYVARVRPQDLAQEGAFGNFHGRGDEIGWVPPGMDFRNLKSKDLDRLRRDCLEIFERIQPDLIHIQHYNQFGIEIIEILAKHFNVPVIVTIHEFFLICRSTGLMVKPDLRRCSEESPSDCALCFNNWTSEDFTLRKDYILSALSHVDHFISPSNFLRNRFIEWGLRSEQIAMVENLMSPTLQGDPSGGTNAAAGRNNPPNVGAKMRFAFFGNATIFKGIDILLDAVGELPPHTREQMKVLIYGGGFEGQNAGFQGAIKAKHAAVAQYVEIMGAYRHDDVIRLMRDVDWVVVPSISWENSPLVIQEAKAAGAPVLCSDIGGMKEKVRPEVNGAHFTVRSPSSLAAKLKDIVEGKLQVLPQAIDIGAANRVRLNQHLEIYRKYVGSIQ